MLRLIRALSPRVEFSIITLVAFGPFIIRSLADAVFPHMRPPITDAHLFGLVVYEPILFVILATFLWLRGWTPGRIGLALPSPREGLLGIGLFLLAYTVIFAIWWLTWLIAPGIVSHAAEGQPLVAPHLSLTTVILVSALNPVFEEVFVCGYVVSALKGEHRYWGAVHTSTALRLAYHLYQGSVAVFTIIPTGLIFALFYARRGRLWPLIIAHALAEFAALLPFVVN